MYAGWIDVHDECPDAMWVGECRAHVVLPRSCLKLLSCILTRMCVCEGK